MTDYCNGIAYASGYFANENGKQYLVVRNLDSWYAKSIETESKYKSYKSTHNFKRDGKVQWVIKARDIDNIPDLVEIKNIADFSRAYIEIHGCLDLATAKDKKGNYFKKPRLRLYGNEKIIFFLNKNLPAEEKKIQYISNVVDDIYNGKTCAIYYQSLKEIINIFQWIDGFPRNEYIWNKWQEIIKSNDKNRMGGISNENWQKDVQYYLWQCS